MMHFDVIVVGAGSAGATLAARLSEDASREVLLLEAGPDLRSSEALPSLRSVNVMHSVNDEAVLAHHMHTGLLAARTDAQEHRLYLQGRGVGGSSGVNGLFAVRPTREDLDEWAANGCVGWGYYESSLPLMRAMETDLDFPDSPLHGDSGPVPVLRPRVSDFQNIDHAFLSAATGLGHRWVEDLNSTDVTGVARYAYNARDGERWSTNTAYLEPARARKNLTIIGGTIAADILFEGRTAVGVRALRDGALTTIGADEIVVAAGALASPALLMRSGIGPAKHLTELGIEVVADLPVGEGLQDHPAQVLMLTLADGHSFEAGDGRHSRLCLRLNSGIDATPNDLMIACLTPTVPGVDGRAALLVGWVNSVTSRGQVRLTSLDPTFYPRVEFRSLSTDRDMQAMVRVVDELRELFHHPDLAKVTMRAELTDPETTEPVVSIDELGAAGDLTSLLGATCGDVSHATSTCRMGSPDDPLTVVGPDGRVHGLDGLRVADASVLPSVPRANTHLSAVLVGERVAAMMINGAAT